MNFRLACDQVVLLETAANLRASRSKANNFFDLIASLGVGSRNIEGLGETKLTVSLGASQ